MGRALMRDLWVIVTLSVATLNAKSALIDVFVEFEDQAGLKILEHSGYFYSSANSQFLSQINGFRDGKDPSSVLPSIPLTFESFQLPKTIELNQKTFKGPCYAHVSIFTGYSSPLLPGIHIKFHHLPLQTPLQPIYRRNLNVLKCNYQLKSIQEIDDDKIALIVDECVLKSDEGRKWLDESMKQSLNKVEKQSQVHEGIAKGLLKGFYIALFLLLLVLIHKFHHASDPSAI